MSRPTPPTYRTRNWPAYNEALRRRGSLTIWFDPEMRGKAMPTGRRGRQQSYSDAAIQTCLSSMKVLFGMALRQTTGFVESLWVRAEGAFKSIIGRSPRLVRSSSLRLRKRTGTMQFRRDARG